MKKQLEEIRVTAQGIMRKKTGYVKGLTLMVPLATGSTEFKESKVPVTAKINRNLCFLVFIR